MMRCKRCLRPIHVRQGKERTDDWFSDRIAALSPERRELLLRRLKTREQQGIWPQAPGRGQAPPLRVYERTHDMNVPLSFAQQRLWFLHQWDPGSTSYNTLFAFHLSGPLQVSALEHSLATMVQRHEILRTTFEERARGPVQ